MNKTLNKKANSPAYTLAELAGFGLTFDEVKLLLTEEKLPSLKTAKCSSAYDNLVKKAELKRSIDIESSLFDRAKGYLTTELHKIYVSAEAKDKNSEPDNDLDSANIISIEGHNVKFKEIRYVTKYVPSDSSAALIWLYNRRSGRWCKNPEVPENTKTFEEFLQERRLAKKEADENS